MWGATNEELNGLAAVVGLTAFWSNILRTQNYDHNTSVEEPKRWVNTWKRRSATSSWFLIDNVRTLLLL